jgi:hypothetical protein
MTYNEFLKTILYNVKAHFGGSATVNLHTVLKNNGVRLDGLIIMEKGKNVSPTIYLNDFYESFREEVGMSEIMEQILELYEKGSRNLMDFSYIAEFEKVQSRIVFKLINKNENEELLKDVPYTQVLDLAVCYGVFIHDEDIGNGLVLIHDCHLDMWHVTKEEVAALAQKNTPLQLKPCFVPIERVIGSMFLKRNTQEAENGEYRNGSGLFVLTNSEKFMGAGCILYKDLLSQIAGKLGSDLYILPSSVNEVLIIRKNAGISKWDLMHMVKSVNDEEVSREEILSYMVYEYERESDIIHL